MISYKSAGSIFHVQEDDRLCGAAAALTILSDSDVGREVECLKEVEIYGRAHIPSDFSISPGGLKKVLNDERPAGFPYEFQVFSAPQGGVVTGYIVGSLSAQNPVAPAVLILGDGHWITVNGVELETIQNSYRLLMLWVYDPQGREYADSEHSASDNCSNLGVPDYAMFYPQGWNKYFSGSPAGRPKDPLEFICVVLGPLSTSGSPLVVASPKVDPPKDVSIESFSVVWSQWASFYAPASDSPAADVFATARVVKVNKIFIDRNLCYYVLLGGNSTKASLIMDGSGAPISLQLARPGSAYRSLLDKLVDGWQDDDLVWQPCLESFSPHLPFRKVTGGYERLDSRLFSELTTDFRGA